jgi:transcriptional regulator with AAA-type ATPase domain
MRPAIGTHFAAFLIRSGLTVAASSGQCRNNRMIMHQSGEHTREALETIRRRIVEDVVHAVPLRRRRSRRERVAAFFARRMNRRRKRWR